MDSIIREGTLRLQAAEATCDVILSCQGQRLMAHKLMLSIASPILQELLIEDSSIPSVLIFPDISANIMTLILDYIYAGSVIVYSNTLPEFLNVINLLKIHLDKDYLDKHIASPSSESSKGSFNEDYKAYKPEHLIKKNEDTITDGDNVEYTHVMSPNSPEVYSKKNLRKLPSLLPLSSIPNQKEKNKKLYNYVTPSPWCPRIETFFGDPRKEYLGFSDNSQISPLFRDKVEENDSNNNFQYSVIQRTPINLMPDGVLKLNFRDHLKSIDHDLSPQHKSTSEKNTLISPKNNVLNNSIITSIVKSSIVTSKDELKVGTPKKELNKIDKIASKLEKQKSLQLVSNEKISNNVVAVEKLPKHNTEKVEEKKNQNKIYETESSKKENVQFSSDNEDEEKLSDYNDEKIKSKQKSFKCEDCGKCFSQLRNYKYHRSVHKGTKEFAAECTECGKVFNDRGYLSSHMKIHRDRKEYACPHCPKRFNQRVAYNMHLRIHTGVKPHECATCGKTFSRKMLLKQHQRVHTGERPYSCPECGKTFADRSNMSLHARLHTGVKPYACTLCPKSFTKKHHLKTHMNFHTGLKPYTCQKCGLAFSQSSNMRTHYKKCILKSNPSTVQPEEQSSETS